jgi:ribose 1,5-bisphosphokinase PhnN
VGTFLSLGTRRLILAGVYLHRSSELVWIHRATHYRRLTVVRLCASETTLVERLRRREVGSVFDDQLSRTLRQAAQLEVEHGDCSMVLTTDGRSAESVAAEIVTALGWD